MSYEKSLKILALQIESAVGRCIFQDVVKGFMELGHEMVEFSVKRGSDRELVKKIAEFQPNFLFTINHNGLGERITKVLTRRGLPYASWFVDDPTIRLKREYISPYGVIFVWDREYIDPLKDMGFKHVHYLPMATNTEIFKELDLGLEERGRYASNLSFAGMSFYNYYRGCYKEKEDSKTQMILNEIVIRQAQNPLVSISKIFEDVQKEFSFSLRFSCPDERLLLMSFLEAAGMALYRKELLKEICDVGLTLAGDDGWRELLNGIDSSGKIKFLGWINNRTELPKLYNATKINLNITQSQSKIVFNMRVFDIAGCRAFMLTDYRRDLEELFGMEGKAISYLDKKDLCNRADYYLNHPEERKELAARLQEKALKRHTYRHRMKELVEIMRTVCDS